MKHRLMMGLTALVLLLGGAGEANANLIVNGGFEAGGFTDWTVNASFTSVESSGFHGFNPNSGRFFAVLGNLGNTPLGTLSQAISDTAGQHYVLSMYLGSDGNTSNEFRIDWNGTTLFDQTNLPDTRNNASQYNLLIFTVVGMGNDTLTLFERNDPGWLALDDVSLNVAPNAVPEPSAFVISSMLLGMFGGCRLRKRLKQMTTAI